MLIFKEQKPKKKITIDFHPFLNLSISIISYIHCPLVMGNSGHSDSPAMRGTQVPLLSPCMSSDTEHVI